MEMMKGVKEGGREEDGEAHRRERNVEGKGKRNKMGGKR